MIGLYIQNLCLIVTEECNMDCLHCLRGKKDLCVMSDDVIEEVFNQVKWIHNLNICGGEPTLAIDQIKKIIETIILKGIVVDQISITINGSIYSEELINLFDYFIKNSFGRKRKKVFLFISLDKYHFLECQRLGIVSEFNRNISAYSKSKYFAGFRELDYDIYNEGNACNLEVKKEDLITHLPVISYVVDKKNLDIESGQCYIGPLITISTNGIVTEDNTTFEKQKTIYNYGSIFNDRIDKLLIKKGAHVIAPKDFNRENKKLYLKIINNTE